MKKLLLTVLPALVLLHNSFGQSMGTVKGVILDQENKPLEYANVLLNTSEEHTFVKGGITDHDGQFVFENVATGTYYVQASMVGFGNINSEIFTINGNEFIELKSMTLTDGVLLNEVTVTTTRPFIEMNADKIVVNVANSAVAAGSNALEILEKSPGVTLDKDQNISLKGKQGVLVTIDDRNQYMSSQDLAKMLETLPADAIESIEIIHNPSARYDAEGNSGVINIRMKRNENLGYNGDIVLSGRQGRHTNYNGSGSINYRSGKVNAFGTLTHSSWHGFNDLNLNREIPFNNLTTRFDQNSNIQFLGDSYGIRAGADYFPDSKTTIGILTRYNTGNRNFLNHNLTNISGGNAPAFNKLEVDTDGKGDWTQQSYNLNAKRQLGQNAGTLTFDMDFSLYDNPNFTMYTNQYINDTENPFSQTGFLRNFSDISVDIFASRLDYQVTLGKFNVEAGSKVSMVNTSNNTLFEDLIDDTWIKDENRSNEFDYKENVYAGYLNSSTQFGGVNVQVGLRMEHTVSDGYSITLDQQVVRNYTDFFPSVAVSHTIGEKHSLSYNYARRLNRPNYRDLNPFIEFLDDFTFQKGNPFLRPQYAQSFGINYGLGRSLFISANYSKTTEAITQVIEQESSTNTSFQTVANLDNFENYSLTVTAPIVINSKWTSRWNVVGFYNRFASQIPSGTLENDRLSYQVYMSNELTLPQGWRAEVVGNYQSGLVYGLFSIEPRYGIDLGFTKRIMDGKGTIRFGISDIFRTQINNVSIRQDDIVLDVNSFYDSRRVNASLNYRFGNQKVKQARRRTTATDDEMRRIESGNQ
ncbi:MAG TPA: TonB-dependent receptor [Saprospiraceae bacterium]|nr:TonB-dependent receptor [Saprospiraceae bacterium]